MRSPPGIARFDHATLEAVNFGRVSFAQISAGGCLFARCDFRGAELDGHQSLFSGRPQNVFRECRFDEVDLRAVKPGQARFERCTFDDALLDGWQATCAEFADCHFAGRVAQVTFYAVPHGPCAAELEPRRAANAFLRNDFRDAELIESAFLMDIDIMAQRLPESDAYIYLDRFHERIAPAQAQIIRWPDPAARAEALAMLHAASVRYAQQPDVFARREDLRGPAKLRTARRVFETLARVL